MQRRRRAPRSLGVAVLLTCALACAGEREPSSVLTDAMGLLTPDEHAELTRQHEVLLRDHDIDYRVDVVTGGGDLLRYGVQRFDDLEVGSRSRTGRGLLLVLDPLQDAVRLEVGQNLESVYPDAFVAYLEEEQMVPFFRLGFVAKGILAATELVVARAQEAQLRGDFLPPGREAAAGGGAERRARLGAGESPSHGVGPEVEAQDTPEEAVAAYLDAMATRNGNPSLDLYSSETRGFLEGHVMTRAQMDTLVRTYRHCAAEPVRTDPSGQRAVLRYPVDESSCAPWLLVREAGRWRIDLATAARVIRFGAGNAWHFVPAAEHAYAFAFRDWNIDARGFPHAP